MNRIHRLLSTLTVLALLVTLVLQAAPPALASAPAAEPAAPRCTPITPEQLAAGAAVGSGQNLWQPVAGTPAPARAGAQPEIRPVRSYAYTLNRDGMAALLAAAPMEFSDAARANPLMVSLPNPCGDFERFAVQESPIMEPGLAARHPDIKTYKGRGIDDPAATIRFDLTPLGFHASVRSPYGAWYIDPYYHLDDSLYVAYFGVDLAVDPHGGFVERDADSIELSFDGIPTGDAITLPPTGDVLRTYRLALITDPGYAAYHGGPANVTPAKVTLMNRVTGIYEDDLSIRMVLVANNDLLNFDTWDMAIGPNGPCGAAGCFTQSQVTGCSSTTRARYVIGQIIGASNYDIGHLALGQPGGGVANLGVVGRSNKAGGCTGIPTPTGDFYAVDYVAHEMGHQFSGNHTFNGNQLNCSGGNRSAANSVEPGSGSSVMAYAGICLTDDLQAHSDPYFSQRSLQEISTYTASSQAAINEVQTASLRHFGGGNEVQVVTFGPGYSAASTIQPLSVNINAAPSAASRGGAEENGNTVTIATSAAHTLQVGDTVTIAGVGVGDYNGVWTVTAVPSSRSFQYTHPTAGLATSGGGTVTLGAPGATSVGTTATIRTVAAHNRSVGDVVVISGVGVAGYNGTVVISAVPSPRSFEYTIAAALADSGGGSATYSSPFQVRIGGNDSAIIGGSGLAYTAANLTAEINAIAGFAGTVTVSNVAATGFTVTYGGASAGVDVPNLAIVNLSCGGCFASVEETNHGGAFDSFTVNYNGVDSALITNGVDYTSAGIKAAIEAIAGWPAGATVTVANFGGGGAPSNNGFQVTFGGTLGVVNVPTLLSLTNMSAGLSGFFGETDKGGAVDNQGGIITPTGNAIPAVTAPISYTIPLRTPFALTGSAVDGDGDVMVYSWEQNDRGAAAGTSLLNNSKANGPLFAMFPTSAQFPNPLLYDPGDANALTTNPTRVFPDLQQILDNNTNADTGACPTGPIAPPVSTLASECFAESLPTVDYVGFAGVNPEPSLNFRFTARDRNGGVNSGNTKLLLATAAGPFQVTAPNTSAPETTWVGLTTETVTWNVANTDIAPVNCAAVNIDLSSDGGYTYPMALASSTANDGTEDILVPDINTTTARVRVACADNIFFDVSNANFTIVTAPLAVTLTGLAAEGQATPVSTLAASAVAGSALPLAGAALALLLPLAGGLAVARRRRA